MPLFPFADYWWVYLLFVTFVGVILLLDLGILHKHAHSVSFKEAACWSLLWVGLALGVNYLFYRYALHKLLAAPQLAAALGSTPEALAKQLGLEFFTGYIIEEMLSVDNIFVFILIFNYLHIPEIYYHRILFYGILGAVAFRALFISMGSWLVNYEWVMIAFGVLLIATGIKILLVPAQPLNPLSPPWLLRVLNRVLPTTPKMAGQSFFIQESGRWLATPLFVALVFIEAMDIVFALDSVPAIFAITREPIIVFLSNILAIMGLRSLFFLLNSVITSFYYLKYGIGLIVLFIGVKMTFLNPWFGGHFPVSWSLGIIASIIFASIGFSLLRMRRRT